MSHVRSAVLIGFSQLVAELGGDPARLLHDAGLTEPEPGRGDEFVGFRAVADVLADAAEVTRRPELARTLSRRQGTAVLGALGAAATTAATFGDGLRIATRYMDAFAPALDVALDVDVEAGTATFWFAPAQSRPEGDEQLMELLLTRAVLTIRATVGPGFQPLAVLVPHAALGAVGAYETLFGTSVEFGTGVAGERVASADLDRRLDADAAVHELVRSHLDGQGVRRDEPLAVRLRRHVERTLSGGPPTMDALAALVSMNVRTMQRRLTEEGTSVSELIDDVRRQQLERLLADPGVQLSDVARRLGYSEPSVLTRACRRWYAATPTQLRRRLLAGGELGPPNDG